ncbi:hypothetical protein WJ977_19215 [Achromobacter xylosoxidans]
MLFWPGTALAAGSGHSPPDLQIGLAAGIAVACAAACAVAWIYSRAAIFGAGLAFALVEGILRAQPALFPAGALQAGSYAALLALSIPLISGRPVASRLAAACHWTCIALTGVAALALIFVYDGDGGMAPALIAGAGAAASAALALWFLAAAARSGPQRAATAALGLAYLLSIAILARDAGFVPGDGSWCCRWRGCCWCWPPCSWPGWPSAAQARPPPRQGRRRPIGTGRTAAGGNGERAGHAAPDERPDLARTASAAGHDQRGRPVARHDPVRQRRNRR